jgi:PQQ-dependent dehydrogenase (methanol/ethanol family)
VTRRSAALASFVLTLSAFAARAADPPFQPVTDALLQNPDAADWLMWRRTQDSWGYSPLDEIDRTNVRELALAWSMDLDDGPSQEGIPLVYDGVLYYPAPLDVTYALDAATGSKIWEHRRKLPEDLGTFVPFPHTNRNLAIYGNLLIDNGADSYVYALDARTGRPAWETEIYDFRARRAKHGSAPFVARGVLISGRNCQPQGGPESCVITGHDARTGRELWRKRTIPKPGEPGGDSWGDVADERRWHVGAWMIPSYDPDLDLVYIGTSVTAPAPKFMIAGNDKQYLYHNSTLALRPATGETVWYYQHAVDHWDLDHPFERMLIDVAVAPSGDEVPWINPHLRAGEVRKVMTGIPGKTGLVYTLDRATGEFLWARPTIMQNVISSIAGDGRVTIDEDALFTGPNQERFVCPTTHGGKNWPAGAYSPRTKTMYFPMQNTCMTATSVAAVATPELIYAINNQVVITPGTDQVGTIQAIDAQSGKTRWKYDQRTGVTALVATGGDLIFGGDVGGKFRALDAETGKVLWETDLGAQVTGHPVTFAAAGKQYVAVSTGRSNLTGSLARLTPEAVPDESPNRLFVFALPR